MTFRRLLGAISTAACILAGLLRLLVLIGSTDSATGFLLSGSLLVHYLILAAPLAVAGFASLAIPANTCHRSRSAAGLPAFCGLLFSGVVGICLFALRHSTPAELAAAILLALGSLWFSGLILRGSAVSPVFGTLGALGWLVICVMLFSGKISSLYHTTDVIELLSCAGLLLSLCGILRAAYSPNQPHISRMVFFRGMLAFYLGFCLLLPQELYLWKLGQTPQVLPGKGIAAALLGVSGLIWALHCMGSAGEPVEDENVAEAEAAFEAANRRLLLDDAAAHGMGSEAINTSDAPQPQRWNSAASALYGTSVPLSTADAAPETVPAAEPAAAEPAFFKPSAAEPVSEVFPTPADNAEAPQTAPSPITSIFADEKVSPSPAAAPVAESSTASADAAFPPKADMPENSGPMARLNQLLASIDTAPKDDAIDALLADLDRLADKKGTEESSQDNKKWFFRDD